MGRMERQKGEAAMREERRFDAPLPEGSSGDLPLQLRLPVPPSTNHLYVTVFKKRVLSAEGKKYKRYVQKRVPALRRVLEDNEWLVIKCAFHVPLYNSKKSKHAKKQWDVTNRIKVLEDAVCDGLGVDDRAVIRVELDKVDAAKADSYVAVSVEVVRE